MSGFSWTRISPRARRHTGWNQLVIRGRPDSDSFLACYVNAGRIDAAIAVNRSKDLRRVLQLIKSSDLVNVDDLADENHDLRAIQSQGP